MDKSKLNLDKLVEQLKIFGDIILLESQKKDHPSSERSYLAAMPNETIFGSSEHNYTSKDNVITQFNQDPWQAIKNFQLESEDWIFGYFGYDLKNNVEHLESNNARLSNLPLYYFMKPKLLIEFDTDGNYKILLGELPGLDADVCTKIFDENLINKNESSIEKDEYVRCVEYAKGLIHEGEVYELNYSYLNQYYFEGCSWHLYKKMREAGPVPFGAYLELNDIKICCASPERFLKRENNHVHSQPIKGTISNSEKSELADLNSEKNRAENLMIVDLVRNDLNRVAKPGTVKVDKLFEVQTFDTVHQLVSTVECEVDESIHSIDIIKACFPMGSMTGAPKIAAMKAIEKLENYSRGIYSGAIGYFSPNGDFDFNVVIRSAIIEDNQLLYPVGGAITSDSKPEDEWEETLIKMLALKKALK